MIILILFFIFFYGGIFGYGLGAVLTYRKLKKDILLKTKISIDELYE
jgi:hypothetical protein